jgi:hypothetical protein
MCLTALRKHIPSQNAEWMRFTSAAQPQIQNEDVPTKRKPRSTTPSPVSYQNVYWFLIIVLNSYLYQVYNYEPFWKQNSTIFVLFGGEGGDWGLNSRLCPCQAGTPLLEPHHQPVFALVMLEMGSSKLFAGTGLEPRSSWSHLPKQQGLQGWDTSTQLFLDYFLCCDAKMLWIIISVSNF